MPTEREMSRDFDRVYLGQMQGILWSEFCELPGEAKAIGNYYLWRASTENGEKFTKAYASIDTVARATGYGRTTVKKYSQLLCDLAILERVERPVLRGYVYEYRLNETLYDLVSSRISSGEKGALKALNQELWGPGGPLPLLGPPSRQTTGSPDDRVAPQPGTQSPDDRVGGRLATTIYPKDLPQGSTPPGDHHLDGEKKAKRGTARKHHAVTPGNHPPTPLADELPVQARPGSEVASEAFMRALPPDGYQHPFWLTADDKVVLAPGVEAAKVWRSLLDEYPEAVLQEAMIAAAPDALRGVRNLAQRHNKGRELLAIIRKWAQVKLKYHKQEKRNGASHASVFAGRFK